MKFHPLLAAAACVSIASTVSSQAAVVVYAAAGDTPAAITPARDAFRSAIGGGSVAGANGSFGGLRREINWDGVPNGFSDPNPLPGNFFNVNSPRGVVMSTPGTGFLVSSNAGAATPTVFGFPLDFQVFTAQRLFTAVSSNITDISFFVPGTTTPATTSAFGVVFTDVEVDGSTMLEFFDLDNRLIFSETALVSVNSGLTFLGGAANAGELISRVRITSGANTIVSNGVLGNPSDDAVVMDDFIYAEPAPVSVPENGPGSALVGLLLAVMAVRRRRR